MEEVKTETLDSTNEETQSETEETSESAVAQKEEFTKLKETNRQLFERAKKAETSEKELKEKLKGLSDVPKEEAKPAESQSSEPNYGRLAFLQSKGIDNPDDIKVVEEESIRLKLPLTDVLGMEHIQGKLKTAKEAREAQAGMPKGTDRTGGSSPQDVDYHLAKGTTPDDQKLAEKVVDARMKNDPSQKKFSDELFTG